MQLTKENKNLENRFQQVTDELEEFKRKYNTKIKELEKEHDNILALEDELSAQRTDNRQGKQIARQTNENQKLRDEIEELGKCNSSLGDELIYAKSQVNELQKKIYECQSPTRIEQKLDQVMKKSYGDQNKVQNQIEILECDKNKLARNKQQLEIKIFLLGVELLRKNKQLVDAKDCRKF